MDAHLNGIKDTRNYFNRELSWLAFNDRVLEEAADPSHPLLERLKFLSIFSSNLDEFYMIRVSGLKEQFHAGVHDRTQDGLTADEQLRLISNHVHHSVARQSLILLDDILPALAKKNIRLRSMASLRKNQRDFLEVYFREKVFPVLTPLAVDPLHPFPHLKGLGLNLLVEVRAPYRQESKVAVLHLPSSLPRFVELPCEAGKWEGVLIEDLVRKMSDQLFPNMKVIGVSEFRLTRNADLDLSEAEADDLLKLIERELRKRRLGTVIRLEVSQSMSPSHRDLLKRLTGLTELDVFDVPSFLDLAAFMSLMALPFSELKDKPFKPTLSLRLAKGGNIFQAISKGDILLHHPFESFSHVIDFVEEASVDPKVLAIKITLYRTSGQSPIVQALKNAVENGKQVTALIELKARFDEQNNIEWAKELDRAGVNVVYGVLGLKTHCKICMVVRSEEGTIKRYLHMSTGNYNEKTARIYTDLSLLTCNQQMGEDASAFFNLLTGYSLQKRWNSFLVAPHSLREELVKLIHECIRQHSEEHPSRIIMVMNSLVDPDIIRELYRASQAGVQINLIVRGICCLRPGVKGLSENITAKSIVGRFLEHSRVYYFKYGGQSRIFLGSADLMQRNLDRRVELVFPVTDPAIKGRVREIIQFMLEDNVKSRYLNKDGEYLFAPLAEGEKPFNVQEYLLYLSQEKQRELDTIPGN
jgi:polyphosphate kinase